MTTQTMTARTRSRTVGGNPTREALAARSLAAVDRIADTTERFAAFSRHMDRFPPLIAS